MLDLYFSAIPPVNYSQFHFHDFDDVFSLPDNFLN